MKFKHILFSVVVLQVTTALATSDGKSEKDLMQRTEKAIATHTTNQEIINELTAVIAPLEKKLALLHRSRAEAYFQNKKWDLALKDYQSVLAYYPTVYIEFSIGRCYYEQTRYYDAILIFDKVIDKIPDNEPEEKFLCSYYKLVSLINMENYDQATPLYNSLKKEKPSSPELMKLAEYFEGNNK